jgi:hypothetical protein
MPRGCPCGASSDREFRDGGICDRSVFATFIVGSSLIGASFETVGHVSGKARYERLARLIAFTLIAMMIDIVASYMLTRHPSTAFWQMIFNPTMLYLDSHRIVGNLAWTGLGLA